MITTTLESAPRVTDALASAPDLRDVLSPEVLISHVGTITAQAGWEMLTSGARVLVLEADADAASITVNIEAMLPGSFPGGSAFEQWCLDLKVGSGAAMEDIIATCSCTAPHPTSPSKAACEHVAAVGFHLLGYPDVALSLPSGTGRETTLFNADQFEEYVDYALANDARAAIGAEAPSARFYDFAIFATADNLSRAVSDTGRGHGSRLVAFLALARLVAEYEPNVTRRFGVTYGTTTSVSRLAGLYNVAVKAFDGVYVRATDSLSADVRREIGNVVAERNVRAVMALSRCTVDRAMACGWVEALGCVADMARPHLEAYAAHRHVALDQHRTLTYHNVRSAGSYRRADLAKALLAEL